MPASSASRPAEPGGTRPHLRALTGLRAVVALDIVFFHFGQGHLGQAPQWLRAVVSRGFETVPLFFVLSGFILAYVYLDGRRDVRQNRHAFWIARFSRVYPTYLFALGLIAPLTIRQLLDGHSAAEVLKQTALVAGLDLPMLQAWLPWAENWNYPAWALSAEAFFYFVFPFVGYYVARLSQRGLALAAGGFYGLSLAAPPLVTLLGHALGPDGLGLVERSQEWTIVGNPVLNLPSFLVGIALGRLFLERDSLADRGFRPRWLVGLLLSALGAVGTIATLAGYPAGLPVEKLWLACFALLILGLAYGSGPLAWLLSSPVAILLGEASYGIYILQLPVLRWTELLGPKLLGAPPDSGRFFALYLLALVGLSVLALYAIERPARDYLRRAIHPSRAGSLPDDAQRLTPTA